VSEEYQRRAAGRGSTRRYVRAGCTAARAGSLLPQAAFPVKTAEWLFRRATCRRPSFVPPRTIARWRGSVRHRVSGHRRFYCAQSCVWAAFRLSPGLKLIAQFRQNHLPIYPQPFPGLRFDNSSFNQHQRRSLGRPKDPLHTLCTGGEDLEDMSTAQFDSNAATTVEFCGLYNEPRARVYDISFPEGPKQFRQLLILEMTTRHPWLPSRVGVLITLFVVIFRSHDYLPSLLYPPRTLNSERVVEAFRLVVRRGVPEIELSRRTKIARPGQPQSNNRSQGRSRLSSGANDSHRILLVIPENCRESHAIFRAVLPK